MLVFIFNFVGIKNQQAPLSPETNHDEKKQSNSLKLCLRKYNCYRETNHRKTTNLNLYLD